jgi:chromosome segregation ATPase
VWSDGGTVDPEYQALEDVRFDTQRELDRAHRFGSRPIEDIWDQIYELNSSQGWSNTDSQIESEKINIELRRLYDLAEEIQNGVSSESNRLGDLAAAAQDELYNLQNFGLDAITQLQNEIARLEAESSASAISANSIAEKISQLKSNRSSYEVNRDSKFATLRETLSTLEAEAAVTTTTTTTGATISADSADRIAELERLILNLQAEAEDIVAAKNSEIIELNAQITEKLDSYNQLIADATASFQVVSEGLLADAAAIGTQIDELGSDAEANADQIAELQLQKDALLAQELAEQSATDETVSQFASERDSGVAELQASIDSIQAAMEADLTVEIYAEIATHNAELSSLQTAAAVVVETIVTISNTQTSADVQAEIDTGIFYWISVIGDITNQINTLENELLIGTTNDATDTRIHSLKLQVAEKELVWNNKSTELSDYIQELYRQMEAINSGNSGRLVEIEAQIEEMDARLTDIWSDESTHGLDHLQGVRELEKQAMALENEHEQTIRRLQEELWDLEDRMSLFDKDRVSGTNDKSSEFEVQSAALQQRRFDLEELSYALEQEQRAEMDLAETQIRESKLQFTLIAEEKFETIRTQIQSVELELRDFYAQQRVIENEIRDAEGRIEDKKRELENKLLDVLEHASGSLGEPGVDVPTLDACYLRLARALNPRSKLTTSRSSSTVNNKRCHGFDCGTFCVLCKKRHLFLS